MSEAARDPKVWTLVAIPLLLPFGAAPELPVLVAAFWSLAMLRNVAWRAPGPRLALVLFGAYWLPELLSAFDSYDARKSWLEVAADLRFGLLLLFAAVALRDAARVRFACRALAAIAAFWCADALVQAATGVSLGGAARVDRLSGIFGDDNLKLGGVMAVMAAFLLLWAWPERPPPGLPPQAGEAAKACPHPSPSPAREGSPGWGPALALFLPLLAVVLLAGARAAWIALAVVAAGLVWRRLGARRGALALGGLVVAGALAIVVADTLSPRFAERIDRTAAVLRGDPTALDYALSHRLPIWHAALAMTAAHPVNGVGVRAFRDAYADYAAPDDPWLDLANGSGALHAHQWLLEVLSETGTLGLLCWLAGLACAMRAWLRAAPAARERAAAPAYALAAMLFPFNTHYAMYSTFWSLLLFSMLALWLAALHAEEPA
jgi:O-antigen ligase